VTLPKVITSQVALCLRERKLIWNISKAVNLNARCFNCGYVALEIVNDRESFANGFDWLVLRLVIPFQRTRSGALVAVQDERDQLLAGFTRVTKLNGSQPVNSWEDHGRDFSLQPLLLPLGATVPRCWHAHLPH